MNPTKSKSRAMEFRFSPSHTTKSISRREDWVMAAPAWRLTAGDKAAAAGFIGVLRRHRAPGFRRAFTDGTNRGANRGAWAAAGGSLTAQQCWAAACRGTAEGVAWLWWASV